VTIAEAKNTTSSEMMPPELEIKTMREYYVTISRYLISHLPIDDDILKHLEILHPVMQQQQWNNKMTEETHCRCSSYSKQSKGAFCIGRVDSIYT